MGIFPLPLVKLITLTRAATCWAMACRALVDSLSVSAITTGLPVSPPITTRRSKGTLPKNGTFFIPASFCPPPSPNIVIFWWVAGSVYGPMFSITPMIGIFSCSNAANPLSASPMLTSCGVVTMMPITPCATCASESWLSPVPGGMSTTR